MIIWVLGVLRRLSEEAMEGLFMAVIEFDEIYINNLLYI